jgi:hypothetical protein
MSREGSHSFYTSASGDLAVLRLVGEFVPQAHPAHMTEGEALFERFCALHGLPCARVAEGKLATPHYHVDLDGTSAAIEIKQIDEDENFSSTSTPRTVGSHVRAKINEARNQVLPAAMDGMPAILLIYNNLDPLQAFGTEQHDFVTAMYGERTVVISVKTGKILDSFQGRNKSFRSGKNDSFSAVGYLKRSDREPIIHLYENLYAKVPLEYGRPPACLTCTRFEVDANGDA